MAATPTSLAPTAAPGAAGLFATSGSPRLTLVTRAGDWNPSAGRYNERVLVDRLVRRNGVLN